MKKDPEQVTIFESINRRDQYLMEFSFFWELEVSQFALPAHKREMIFCQEEIENSLSFGEEDIIDNISKRSLKLSIGFGLNRWTNRPYDAICGDKVYFFDIFIITLSKFAIFEEFL